MTQQFSICNETFKDWTWEDTCAFVSRSGYDGVEVAPFTFGPNVQDVPHTTRREIRQVAADNGLLITGLHWLLVSPPGLHIHSRDLAVRRRTTEYMQHLIDFASDIGAPLMVFGSPAQRRLEDGDREGARSRLLEVFQGLLPHLSARNVILCQESLPPPECDFVQTTAEAAELVLQLDDPHYRLMLDTKSMSAEDRPPAEVIEEFCPLVKHFHANDRAGGYPGSGDTDFAPIAAALKRCHFSGFVSVEVFDYSPGPEVVARRSIEHLKSAFHGA